MSVKQMKRWYRTAVHSVDQAKPLKKPKPFKVTNQRPWINFIDPENTEFLQYTEPKLRAHGEICTFEDVAEVGDETKDILFVGRSNVGKSSLLN